MASPEGQTGENHRNCPPLIQRGFSGKTSPSIFDLRDQNFWERHLEASKSCQEVGALSARNGLNPRMNYRNIRRSVGLRLRSAHAVKFRYCSHILVGV